MQNNIITNPTWLLKFRITLTTDLRKFNSYQHKYFLAFIVDVQILILYKTTSCFEDDGGTIGP